MNTINQAKLLKIAAVAIAAPRYMGAFGAAIGLDVLQMQGLGLLPLLEIYSGDFYGNVKGELRVLKGSKKIQNSP